MRQLLLLRHAKSSRDQANLEDHQRPLNAQGRDAAAVMRRLMRERGLTPDLVLVSSARRTLDTLAALEPWDEAPLVEQRDTLYLASAEQIMSALHDVAETVRSVLVIGHNPGLHDCAVQLIDPHDPAAPEDDVRRLREGFPTASLAEFALARPWAQLAPGGARLQHFLVPRDIPASIGNR